MTVDWAHRTGEVKVITVLAIIYSETVDTVQNRVTKEVGMMISHKQCAADSHLLWITDCLRQGRLFTTSAIVYEAKQVVMRVLCEVLS